MTAVRETGSVTVSATIPALPSLRLRSAAPRPAVQFLTLRDLSKRQDVLRALVQLQSLVAELTDDDVKEATRRLFLLLNTLEDPIVKEKSVDLLGRLACATGAGEAGQIALALCSSLQKTEEETSSVTCQLLLSLAAICQHWIASELCQDVALECTEIVTKLLPTSAAPVRRAALHLLATLAPIEQRMQNAASASGLSSVAAASSAASATSSAACEIQRHCAAGINDDEPRVRAAALRGLIRMNDQGMPLQLDVYERLSCVLVDDYADVRAEAMQLVWRYCQAFPDKPVNVDDGGDVKLPLLDDGFVKICDMMNDLAMPVRSKAAALLGSLHNVSFEFLQQTLDKKLMSHLRAKSSEHDKLKERYRSNMTISEWESGRKWNDGNIPKKDFDPTNVQLISNGACGAFVHGLEDEFLEVRKASVESMTSLAVQCPKFAALCVDYIVDMLNDEIQAVRLAAMACLQQIMTHLELRDDQLDTFLSGLSDSSPVARNAVRDLLTVVQLSSCSMLQSCLKSLQTNLTRYPTDKTSIYKCMAELGDRHSNLVMAITPSLLGTDLMFATPEPDIEQTSYLAHLILIFNALPHCPTMKASFPTFMAGHYAFLKSSLPDLVPQLEFSGSRLVVPKADSQSRVKREEAVEGSAFIEQSVRRALAQKAGASRLQFIKLTLADMQRLSEINSPTSTLASWSCLYLQACSLLENAIHDKRTTVAWNSNQAAKVLCLSYQAEHLYAGLGAGEQLAVAELRLVAHALQLLHSTALARDDVKLLLKRINRLDKRCQTFNLQAGTCLQHLLMQSHELERGKISAVVHCLLDATQAWQPVMVLPDSSLLRKASGSIRQPSNPGHIYQFSTSLATSISVDATLTNVDDVRRVVLQVMFPDQTRRLMHASSVHVVSVTGGGSGTTSRSPSCSAASSASSTAASAATTVVSARGHSAGAEQRQHLAMEPVISHHVWSESSHVEVMAVLSFVADQDEMPLLATGNGNRTAAASAAAEQQRSASSSGSSNLPPLTPGFPAGDVALAASSSSTTSSSSDLLLSQHELAILTHSLLPLGNTVRYAIHPKERIYVSTH